MKFVLKVDTERLKATELIGIIKLVDDPAILDELAKSNKSKGVWIAIAQNENVSGETCNYIIDYCINNVKGSWMITEAMAKNPKVSKVILDKLIETARTDDVIKFARKNPNYQK